MKKNQSFILILLAASVVFSGVLMTACAETAGNTPATDSGITSAESIETEKVYVTANLPDTDFEGETFTFYGRIYDGAWSAVDILTKEIDGEQINDALYERTAYIEDKYNAVLETIASENGTVTSLVKTLISAADTSFQAIVCNVYDAGAISVEGMLTDLNHVENLDLSQRWWAQATNESLTIAGKQFYATGDIFIIDNKATRVFFFNKDMISDFNLENPYALVKNNEWTLDNYFALNEAVKTDLNGDNQMSFEFDCYGTMAQTTLGTVLYLASGELITAKDENDIPYITCGTDRALTIMTTIAEKVSQSSAISLSESTKVNGTYPDNLVYFQEGRALFAPEVLLHIETMRDCIIDIGILPPPKYDEKQSDYYCYADGWCVNTVSIPVTNSEPGRIGFILEAMAADSLNNLTPAYYDICLTNKYVRDEESAEMLDLIFSKVVMDNANIFSWGSLQSAVSSAIADGSAIASAIESKRSATEKAIEKTVTAYEDIEG
ncbi:MAG: type 2 periplasmic-binding domain-containing protein [Eubacteriales bacterium]